MKDLKKVIMLAIFSIRMENSATGHADESFPRGTHFKRN
jgi:hypothetical protein